MYVPTDGTVSDSQFLFSTLQRKCIGASILISSYVPQFLLPFSTSSHPLTHSRSQALTITQSHCFIMSFRLALPSFLCFLIPLVAATASPVCTPSQTGYDTRQFQYFYNAFCEDLDIKGYVVDQQVYGLPIMSLGFQPAAGSLCGLNNCLSSYAALLNSCMLILIRIPA